MSSGGVSAAGSLWRDPAEFGESCLVINSVGVIADRDEELPGNFGADAAAELEEIGGSAGHEGIDLSVELLDLSVQCLPATGKVAQ